MTLTPLDQFTPDPHNANDGTERGAGMLERSLEKNGAGRSILVDKNGVVIAGNKTQQAALDLGILDAVVVETDGSQVVVVKRTDLDLATDGRARELAYFDNRTSEVSLHWNPEQMLIDLDNGIDLSALWTDGELETLLAGLRTEETTADPGAQVDRAGELREKWQTERGQVWQVGRHRVMCGDSTSTEDVARVMGGSQAVMMWTDPPYGVDYVGKTKDALTIENDGAQNLPELLRCAFLCADSVLTEGSPVYVAHPPGALCVTFGNAFIATGWKFHETLIWVKDSMVLGHSDYHFQHEPMIYGWKGSNRFWYGDRSQKSLFLLTAPSEAPTILQ